MNRSDSHSGIGRRQRMMATVLACSVLSLLPGCRIPGLRDPQPAPAIPESFNGVSSLESSARLGVNEFFQDSLLTDLVAKALAGNQELKILEEEVEVARNEILARQGTFLPFLSLSADGGLDRSSLYTPLGTAERQLPFLPGKHFPDPLTNVRLGADLFWQIDIWRQLRNARDAAIQRYYAAIERRNFFVTQLVSEIAADYFELLSLDQRLQILDQIIGLQEQSLKAAEANKEAGRGTELGVQRFLAEVRKNQSEKLIVMQDIVQAENRINFRVGRYPQPVQRISGNFLDLNLQALNVGIPAQLLLYRTDIRQAERELEAAGLDVLVARARFFPRLNLTGSVGFEAFNPRYLFNPEALIGGVAGELVQPFINLRAIQADYNSANAKQLQAVYNYQRVILNAFTEVVNYLARADNYYRSVEIKKEQLKSLEISVEVASNLFQSGRADYIDVLFAQRDLLDARIALVAAKLQQLLAMVNAYRALGGGVELVTSPDARLFPEPLPEGEDASSLPVLPPPLEVINDNMK